MTINDSARSAGLEIPIDVFFESWRDSNFSMTITDQSMPGDGTAAPPVEVARDPDAPGVAILGTTIEAQPGPEESHGAGTAKARRGRQWTWAGRLRPGRGSMTA